MQTIVTTYILTDRRDNNNNSIFIVNITFVLWLYKYGWQYEFNATHCVSIQLAK